MNRIVAILTVTGILFTGLAAVSLQLSDYNSDTDTEIFDGINAIANVSFVVAAFVGIFVAGVIVLLAAVASMGDR